jgi:hypothetical protein
MDSIPCTGCGHKLQQLAEELQAVKEELARLRRQFAKTS